MKNKTVTLSIKAKKENELVTTTKSIANKLMWNCKEDITVRIHNSNRVLS